MFDLRLLNPDTKAVDMDGVLCSVITQGTGARREDLSYTLWKRRGLAGKKALRQGHTSDRMLRLSIPQACGSRYSSSSARSWPRCSTPCYTT